MRRGDSVKTMTRQIFATVPALLLLLSAALAFSAEADSQTFSAPPSLAGLVQPNSQISDVSNADGGARPASPSEYRIDTGDRLSVTVYQEPDLSITGVRVKANGTIAYPLLGELEVAGLTSQELHDLVKARLLDGYLKKPNITVSIDGYRLYYIKGEVNRPGGYSFVDGLTVAKAVALAGGYTARASERSINLVRESNPGETLESVPPNMPIRPGDIVTVGESFF
jgi:polysaccharide biosynthesis/export protein VpsN